MFVGIWKCRVGGEGGARGASAPYFFNNGPILKISVSEACVSALFSLCCAVSQSHSYAPRRGGSLCFLRLLHCCCGLSTGNMWTPLLQPSHLHLCVLFPSQTVRRPCHTFQAPALKREMPRAVRRALDRSVAHLPASSLER